MCINVLLHVPQQMDKGFKRIPSYLHVLNAKVESVIPKNSKC